MFGKFIKKLFPERSKQADTTQPSTEGDGKWTCFKRFAGRDYHLVLVNTSLLNESQVISECWFELKYHFLAEQLNGGWMPSPETSSTFYSLENTIEQAIKAVGGRMAASMTGDGVRRVLYCAPNLRLEDILRKQASACKEIQVEVRPSTYHAFESLLPTELELKLMHNEKILETLIDHGDNGSVERSVMHWITGISGNDVDNLCSALESLGYSIEESAEDTVKFSRVTAISLEAMAEETENLMAFCSETGCIYDGWETPVIRPTKH